MKILKIFGSVVGIHVFALVLIFANPGCSSTTQSPPAPTDTVAKTDAPPILTPPNTAPTHTTPADTSSAASSAFNFNPNAPAMSAPAGTTSGIDRRTPTRPGTPVATVLVAEPVVDVTPTTTYTVKSGDSLWTIGKKNHITAAELAAANGLSTNAKIQPGQKLILPGKPASAVAAATAKGAAGPTPKATLVPPAATATAAPRASGDAVKHVVVSGDTLEKIARTYGVKQGDIAVANNIDNPAKIKLGTELIIPGWQAPGGKSAKGAKSGTKAGELKVEQPQPAPERPPAVPVIPIFDNPITPAPKT
jgi:LysM repeat protein